MTEHKRVQYRGVPKDSLSPATAPSPNESGRPLRTVVRLTGLPRSFQIKSATFDTSYNDVDIADLGVFLLPAYSEVNLSLRTPPRLRRENSDSTHRIRNVVWFHDCKKLAGKAYCIGCLAPPQ